MTTDSSSTSTGSREPGWVWRAATLASTREPTPSSKTRFGRSALWVQRLSIPLPFAPVPLFFASELEVIFCEFKAELNRYLAKHPKAKVKSLEEIIQFNEAHADEVMPYFRQELLEIAQSKGDLSEPAYLKAKAECVRVARTEGIDKAMHEHRVDAIIAPTDGTPAWIVDPIVGDKILGGCSTPAAMAGYPHITVPAGYVYGLPVGLSFFAGAYQEGNLIRYAYAFEQATQVRRPPTFPATVTA